MIDNAVCTQDAIQPTAVGACAEHASMEGRIFWCCYTTHNHLFHLLFDAFYSSVYSLIIIIIVVVIISSLHSIFFIFFIIFSQNFLVIDLPWLKTAAAAATTTTTTTTTTTKTTTITVVSRRYKNRYKYLSGIRSWVNCSLRQLLPGQCIWRTLVIGAQLFGQSRFHRRSRRSRRVVASDRSVLQHAAVGTGPVVMQTPLHRLHCRRPATGQRLRGVLRVRGRQRRGRRRPDTGCRLADPAATVGRPPRDSQRDLPQLQCWYASTPSSQITNLSHALHEL